MRQVSEHALSVLKSKSIVLRWKRVVSVLSPLSLFSRGGSHIDHSKPELPVGKLKCALLYCLNDPIYYSLNSLPEV